MYFSSKFHVYIYDCSKWLKGQMNGFSEVKEQWKFVLAKPLSQIARDYENCVS